MKIFTYGTLQKNEMYHDILKDAIYLSTGKTKDKFFKYFIKDGYGIEMFPYLLEICSDETDNNIYGEIYKVNKQTLKSVDRFEDGYHRKLIDIQTDFGLEKCWCYFLNKKVWKNIIKG